jgi:exodeoxyribonuclease VII large subunit
MKNEKMLALTGAKLTAAQMRLGEGAAKLSALSPLAVLSRGYGYLQNEDGKTVGSVKALRKGEHVSITLADGCARACIESVDISEKS